MTLLCTATKVILAIMMKTFVLFFSVPARLVFASTWTNVDSGALKFPSLAIIIGAKGLQHDPRKIDSILSMDPLTSLANLNIPWDGPARKPFHS